MCISNNTEGGAQQAPILLTLFSHKRFISSKNYLVHLSKNETKSRTSHVPAGKHVDTETSKA